MRISALRNELTVGPTISISCWGCRSNASRSEIASDADTLLQALTILFAPRSCKRELIFFASSMNLRPYLHRPSMLKPALKKPRSQAAQIPARTPPFMQIAMMISNPCLPRAASNIRVNLPAFARNAASQCSSRISSALHVGNHYNN